MRLKGWMVGSVILLAFAGCERFAYVDPTSDAGVGSDADLGGTDAGSRGNPSTPSPLSFEMASYKLASLSETRELVVADVTGDGKQDLIGIESDYKRIVVFPGDGRGGLGAPIRSDAAVPSLVNHLLVGDLDGNGTIDVAVTADTDGLVIVQYNDGVGHFGSPKTVTFGGNIYGVAIADVTGDGRADILVNTYTKVWAAVQTKSGGLDPPQSSICMNSAGLVVADFEVRSTKISASKW
jgi:hypothetical protein